MSAILTSKYWNSHKTPRWVVVLVPIAAAAVAAVALIWVNIHVSDKDHERAMKKSVEEYVQNMVNVVNKEYADFLKFSEEFVSALENNRDNKEEARRNLIGNIVKQYGIVEPLCIIETQTQERYLIAARSLKEEVEKVEDYLELARYWTATSNMLVAKEDLIKMLWHEARTSDGIRCAIKSQE